MLIRIDVSDLLVLQECATNEYKKLIKREDLIVGGVVVIYFGSEVFDLICGPSLFEVTKEPLEEIAKMMEIYEEDKRLVLRITDQRSLGKLLGLILKTGNYIVDAIQDN